MRDQPGHKMFGAPRRATVCPVECTLGEGQAWIITLMIRVTLASNKTSNTVRDICNPVKKNTHAHHIQAHSRITRKDRVEGVGEWRLIPRFRSRSSTHVRPKRNSTLGSEQFEFNWKVRETTKNQEELPRIALSCVETTHVRSSDAGRTRWGSFVLLALAPCLAIILSLPRWWRRWRRWRLLRAAISLLVAEPFY